MNVDATGCLQVSHVQGTQALMDCKQTPYVQTWAMAANIQPHVARHPEV